MNLAAALALGFLLGSIPFGLLLTRSAGLGDIRNVGSGSIGATNVLRTGRKDIALATLILDAAKGALPVLLALRFMQDPAGTAELAIPGPLAPEFAAIGAILGHMFPPWLGFRGGKGVATGVGVLLALAWPVGLAACAIWAAGAALSRISSVGALSACALTPLVALALAPWSVALTVLVIAVLVFQRHAGNIARLQAGTEPRIGRKR